MTGVPYPPGVVVSVLRAALPGVTVETQQAPDLEYRVPYVACHVQGGSAVFTDAGDLGLIDAKVQFDVWAKPSVRESWALAMRVLQGLSDACKAQTMTPDGYIRYVDTTGDLPQELRLVGQSADLFHFTWTTDIGVRPNDN